MEFKQFTKCIEPTEYVGRARIITIQSLLVGVPAALIAVASNHPVCLWIALEITLIAVVVAYCRNWLYNRLICLGGDVHCLGVIASISPPSPDLIFSSQADKFWDLDWDTDYSINLLLQDCEFGISQEQAQERPPFGELLAPQPGVTAVGLQTQGHVTDDEPPKTRSATLHAEFEGGGNHTLLLGAEAALGLSILALIACLALPFPVWLILGLLALLAIILGGLLGNNDFGSPSDVGAGELHTNTVDPEKGTVGADVVYVEGTWVYDPLHEGWNEIHPIKVCTKMGCWKGDWKSYDGKCDDKSPTPPNVILRLREAFQVARAEETIANQARPEYQWQIHPDLDGCDSVVIL